MQDNKLRDAFLASYITALDECENGRSKPTLHTWYRDCCELLAAQLDYVAKYVRNHDPQEARTWAGLSARYDAYHKWFKGQ